MAEYTLDAIKAAKELLSERSEIKLINRKEYINKRTKIVDWLYFSLAYLKQAKLGCDYLIQTEETKIEHRYDYRGGTV
jgi:hypothetical protein